MPVSWYFPPFKANYIMSFWCKTYLPKEAVGIKFLCQEAAWELGRLPRTWCVSAAASPPCRPPSRVEGRRCALVLPQRCQLSVRCSAPSRMEVYSVLPAKPSTERKLGPSLGGKMEVFSFQVSLPGHEDCGTILIVYNIPHGIQVRGRWRLSQQSAPVAAGCPGCPA